MAWIQDGGSNPWYANFNNTALDFITFNGVQVWASQYSFSITVSYKVGVEGHSNSYWDSSECEWYDEESMLSYVSRFNLSVSNVVGCDTIDFYPLGLTGQLDALKFRSTGTYFEAMWSNYNNFYNIETNTRDAPDFFIDRFYFSSNTQASADTGYSLYDHGTYTTVSSVQADPWIRYVHARPEELHDQYRALKYYHFMSLPDSYYYDEQMQTANYHRWGLTAYGCNIPLKITRGDMTKYLYLDMRTGVNNEKGMQRYGTFRADEADQSATASRTGTASGDW